jgi:hypothetical protein
MTRTSFGAEAIAPFEAVVQRHGLTVAKGRSAGNRPALVRRTYFQFGDLRVDLPQAHVVLEVESAGGLTNLVKYWPCIVRGLINRPIHLVHLFRRASAHDYRSHIELRGFLSEKMKAELGASFDCALFTYGKPIESDPRPALDYFEHLLAEAGA